MQQENPETQRKPEGRPENARRLFILIAVLAGFGVLGGIWSIRTTIDQSLSFTDPSILSNASTTPEQDEDARLLALRTKDTDKDKLTDYQELYEYGTSPYLADSDSDGIDDKSEVDNGQDPNCPEGTTCNPIAIFSPNLGNTNSSTSTTTNANPSVDNLNVDELRVALRNAGAPQSELENLSDAELVALYREVIGDTGGSATNTTNTAPEDSTALTYSELRDLTADEIRSLLIVGGADEQSLAQLDDETLKAVFYESVQNLELNNTSQ